MTKTEFFAAYYPYRVKMLNENQKMPLSELRFYADPPEYVKLMLRPLSALTTPMQHPVTGEEIPNPAEWIADRCCDLGFPIIGKDVEHFLSGKKIAIFAVIGRYIDRLAAELHFDIFGGKAKGWAVEV